MVNAFDIAFREITIMKFLDVKTDFAFKKVSGSEGSKDILISFLNSLVLFSEGEVIEHCDRYESLTSRKGLKDRI